MSSGRLLKLGPGQAAAAFRFCEENPNRCTYIAGWIEDGGLADNGTVIPRAWLLGDTDSRGGLHGLVYISDTGIVIPAIDDEVSIEELSRVGKRNPSAIRVVVGERAAVGRLWELLERTGMIARISRDQLGYAVTRSTFASPPASLQLETGNRHYLDQIVEASAAMALEEARDDPQGRNPELFRTRIEERLERGRDFIHVDHGRVLFKSNVSAVSRVGGQVEGIYTLPGHRGRGIGFAGTAAVTRWVLERSERAFLLVNDDNETAKRIYEKLGYRQVIESRTIFVA
jgi:predicted GNAT family acetyltransferase